MTHLEEEERFHARDRKASRKQRRLAQKTDRSKFKKTNLAAKPLKTPEDVSLHRGRVLAITGESVRLDCNGTLCICPLRGLLKKDTGSAKNVIAVGDWVQYTEDQAIWRIEERFSFLSRIDIRGLREQLIAVNVDQVVISVSIVHPPLKPALVDRYLIAAEKGNLHPILVINKVDLLSAGSDAERQAYGNFLAAYEPLGFPILSLSVKTGVGLDALRSLLKNKTSVFAGQSGVGKSSLLNACFQMQLRVGDLAIKTSKGSHTTTTAQLLKLPGGGYCVDTPGVRSFGVWKLTKQDVMTHFHDFSPFCARCKYPDCLHTSEPGCCVQLAVRRKIIPPLRYESYRTLLEEATTASKHRTWS